MSMWTRQVKQARSLAKATRDLSERHGRVEQKILGFTRREQRRPQRPLLRMLGQRPPDGRLDALRHFWSDDPQRRALEAYQTCGVSRGSSVSSK